MPRLPSLLLARPQSVPSPACPARGHQTIVLKAELGSRRDASLISKFQKIRKTIKQALDPRLRPSAAPLRPQNQSLS